MRIIETGGQTAPKPMQVPSIFLEEQAVFLYRKIGSFHSQCEKDPVVSRFCPMGTFAEPSS